MNFNEYSVKPIPREATKEYILEIHYAKRWVSASYYFGLFNEEDEFCGVVCYGTPSSSTLKRGIAGDEYKKDVLELSRLVLRNNKPNEASFLVSKSMKMLPRNKIIVSFADSSMGHKGYVYQATNFIYCGLSAKRTDWKVKGKEHLHGQTIADEFRGQPNRSLLMREKYGDDFYLKERPRKYRYIYIHGSKTYRKNVLRDLRYGIEDYPK